MRKSLTGWGTLNSWAAPDQTTRAAVSEQRDAAVEALAKASSRGLDVFFGIGKSEAEARLAALLDAERREKADLLDAAEREKLLLRHDLKALDSLAAALRDEVAALRASSSWRLTGPLRRAIRLLRGR